MLFSNQTIYDKSRLIKFNNFVILRKRFFWSFMLACTLIATVCLALSLANDFDSGIIWICTAVIYSMDASYAFCYFVLPHFTINKSPAINANITYGFEEDTLKISAITKNGTESSESNYSAIVKIMESKQDIYLFISKEQGYILDKSGFTVGIPEELLKFLKEKNIPYKR